MAHAHRAGLVALVLLSACASDDTCIIGQQEVYYPGPGGMTASTTAPKRGPCDAPALSDVERAILAGQQERAARIDQTPNPYCLDPEAAPAPWQVWEAFGGNTVSDVNLTLIAEIGELGLIAGTPNSAGEEMLAQNAALLSVSLRQPGETRRIAQTGWLASFLDGLDIAKDRRIEEAQTPVLGEGAAAMRPFVSGAGQPLWLSAEGGVLCQDRRAEKPDNPTVDCAFSLEGGNVYGTISLPAASLPLLPRVVSAAKEVAASVTALCVEGASSGTA